MRDMDPSSVPPSILAVEAMKGGQRVRTPWIPAYRCSKYFVQLTYVTVYLSQCWAEIRLRQGKRGTVSEVSVPCPSSIPWSYAKPTP